MTDPIDRRFAAFVRPERERPDPDGETKARVFARVQATLAFVPPQTPEPSPPSPSPAPSAPSPLVGVVPAVHGTLLPLLLAGGAIAVFVVSAAAWRTTMHPGAPRPGESSGEPAAAVVVEPIVPVGVPGMPSAAPSPGTPVVPLPMGTSVTPAPGDVPSAPRARFRPRPSAAAPADVSDLAAERQLLDRARGGLLQGNAPVALAAIDEHARSFPHGVLSEERDALRVEALVAGGRYDEARASASRFRAAYPGSLLGPAVRDALGAIP